MQSFAADHPSAVCTARVIIPHFLSLCNTFFEKNLFLRNISQKNYCLALFLHFLNIN